MVPKAIMIREFGNSRVLQIEEVNIGSPGEGELFISQSAIGVHYHDIYVRTGLYKTLNLPGVPGIEATGTVESIGPGVTDFKRGDRIVYVTSSYGAYTTHRLLDARLAVKLPEFVSDELIATNFSRALTVQMLTKQVLNLQSSHTILVTAASGGVGRLLCQYANSLGVRVIGSVSTFEKAELARSYGCDYSLIYGQQDFIRMVMDITDGKGVDVVYDSVGADTFFQSLEVLSLCGHLVNFGQSSGPVDPLRMTTLAKKSLTISRPILFHYTADTAIYKTMAYSVFNIFREGTLRLPPAEPRSLKDASTAHDILESRRGGGSLYLVP
tara:strand:+ start:1169 stop:2146 length:978 start_codon:yes stop_codon:yes gene_type:complete